MASLFTVLTILTAPFSFAADVSQETLVDHAKKRGFSDNRYNLRREPYYSGWKDCCKTLQPHTRLEAFWRKGTKEFRQVKLSCDYCGTREGIPDVLVPYCKEKITDLFTDVYGQDPPKQVMEQVTTGLKEITLETLAGPVRLKERLLKCDGAGGRGIEVAIGPDEPPVKLEAQCFPSDTVKAWEKQYCFTEADTEDVKSEAFQECMDQLKQDTTIPTKRCDRILWLKEEGCSDDRSKGYTLAECLTDKDFFKKPDERSRKKKKRRRSH